MHSITDIILNHNVEKDIKYIVKTPDYYFIQNKYEDSFNIFHFIKKTYYENDFVNNDTYTFDINNKKDILFLIKGIKNNIFNLDTCINKVFFKKYKNSFILKVLYNNNKIIFIKINIKCGGICNVF